MNRAMPILPGLWVALLLGACGRSEPSVPLAAEDVKAPSSEPAAAAAPTVFEAMTRTLIPTSNTVWELAGNLYNDQGNIDAAQLDATQWQQMRDAAVSLRDGARALAAMEKVTVAPPGVKILNEGVEGSRGAAEVQAAIDHDPQSFRQAAAELEGTAAQLVAAAEAKDGEKTDAISNQLTDVCGACHMRFWTPGQAP